MSKLTPDTLAKLRNFAAIQPNLVYGGDGKLKTIAENNTLLAEADVQSDLDKPFAIYELGEFLATLELVDDPDVEILEDKAVISGGHVVAEYKFANPNILTSPSKKISMPGADAVLDITRDDLAKLRKASGVLGFDTVVIEHEAGSDKLRLSGANSALSDTGDNSYTIVKDDWDETSEPFKFIFLLRNLILINTDYKVSLSKKRISKWEGTDATYWIALEMNSTYGE